MCPDAPPSDVNVNARQVLNLLGEIPVTSSESSVLHALRQLPTMVGDDGRSTSFGKAAQKLAALLMGELAPSAHELQQSGTLSWLLSELSSARPAELRQRWAEFDRAFGGKVGMRMGQCLRMA